MIADEDGMRIKKKKEKKQASLYIINTGFFNGCLVFLTLHFIQLMIIEGFTFMLLSNPINLKYDILSI
jgi:hypothetical protein